jgi:hypothetical protein
MEENSHHEHPFYGYEIYRNRQEEYIKKILKQFQNDPVNDDLKKKVWDLLQMEKYKGHVTIPFKMAVRRDPAGKFPDYIEVILDSKV